MNTEDKEEFEHWYRFLLGSSARSGKYGMDHPLGSCLMRDLFRHPEVKKCLEKAWQQVVVEGE